MSLFGKSEKTEIERLKALIPDEAFELEDLKKELAELRSQIAAEKATLEALKSQIIETDEAALMQSFGLYTPHYSYETSDEFKAALDNVRSKQKEMVKAKTAVVGNTNWTVNGKQSEGKKMVSDMCKLFLRAFNAECDDAIDHVKFNNVEACEKKIQSSAEAITKLGTVMGIRITKEYLTLKLRELYLMHEYRVKKQDEKEAAKEARAKLREEAKLLREIEEARKKLEKEQAHYSNALQKINLQLEQTDGAARIALEEKKAQLEQQLGKVAEEIKVVDYREANQKAGYVYIISNLGAFGENVYKIGMTRRLEPLERIDELSDASVPFNFDVHAMIFSDNAPALEAALHNAFASKKLNYVNQRREFFAVTLDEIKAVVKANFDKTVEFIDVAPAEQYRKTLLLKAQQ